MRRLQPVGPVHLPMLCPSDTASWLDCVYYNEPALDLALATASGQDWADRWTITRLGADLKEKTTTVAGTSTRMFDDAESIRRMTNRYGQSNRTGIEFMQSTGREHAFESLAEQGVLRQIDMSQPFDVVTQPFWLSWHDGSKPRRHCPNFLVRERHGTTLVNVRPEGLMRDKDAEQFAALSAVAARLGWRHVVVVGLVRPHAINVDALSSARRPPHDPLGLQALMHKALAPGPARFGDIVAGTVAPALARAVLMGMIWRGEAAIDLSVLLGDGSAVRLGTAR